MNGNGWIKLYRQVKHSSIWKSPIQLQVWIAILLSAELDGTIHVNSIGDLLDKLDISCSKRTFYYIIRKLEKEDMITLQEENGIIIKVNNWEKYQMTENTLQPKTLHTVCTPFAQGLHKDDTEQMASELDDLPVDNSTLHTVCTPFAQGLQNFNEKPTGNAGSLDAKEKRNNNNIYINTSKDVLRQNSEIFKNSSSNNEKDLKDLPTPPISADPPLPKTSKPKKTKKDNEHDLPAEVLQEAGIEPKKIDKKEVLSLIGKFCNVMNYPFNADTIKKNYKFAVELLQNYSEDDIIKAVQQGIEIYKKEGKTVPSVYIPTLASVRTMIHVWLGEAIKKEEIRRKKYDF